MESAEHAPLSPQVRAARAKALVTLAQTEPRRARIMDLRRAGKSLSEVAAEVGLTRQRVHAILRACAPELAGRQQHTPAA